MFRVNFDLEHTDIRKHRWLFHCNTSTFRKPKLQISVCNIHHQTLQNSGAKYVDNKLPRQFQNFSVCLGNKSAKKLPKTQQKPIYYVGNGFGIPHNFAKSYDSVFNS